MSNENNAPIEDDLPEQLRIRREKRAALIQRGVEPYPVSVARTKSLKEVRAKYSDLAIDVATGDIKHRGSARRLGEYRIGEMGAWRR